jgi:hypothetical protein
LVQYRWPGTAPREAPVPVSATVAVVAGFFFPAAVKVAVTVPELVGAKGSIEGIDDSRMSSWGRSRRSTGIGRGA